MAAPKGNQFWLNASKHGRDKIFSTPAILWDAACEYFQWCVDNPLMEDNIEVLRINGEGDKVEHHALKKMRPFTMQGLCIYLQVNTLYFRDFKKGLKPDEKEIDKEFSQIVTRIEDVIYDQKFSGAAAGFLNANIIARDLGLRDKSDVTTNGETLPGASVEELKRIAEMINNNAK